MKKCNEETKKVEISQVVKSHKGKFDTEGVCWTERELSHPERTIRIASTFSGIGAPEQALKRLGLKTKSVFACDIGERYLKYNYKQLASFAINFSDEDKKMFANHLYEGNKSQKSESFTYEHVYENLYVDNTDKKEILELSKECIDMLTSEMSYEEKKAYIDSLYDKEGPNYVKESFFANYDINEKDWHTDIRFLDATKYKGQVDLYVGGSPCTSYSISGKRLGLEDTRGTLFYDFARTIKECEPKVFIFENVKGMLSCGNGETSGIQAAIEVFERHGYHISWQILDGEYYGIPQHRERIWLVGFKDDVEFNFPVPISLHKRMYDYLDTDIPPRSGFVENPEVRPLTGTECLRLMGFQDFKISDKIKSLTRKKRDKILCEQAGNSMVVNCLMALYLQMDITKYGEETRDQTVVDSKPVKIQGTPLMSTKKNRQYSFMNLSGLPTYKIEQLGNDHISEKSPNHQCGRIYSPNGICPTIVHTTPPRILVYNEVPTETRA